jgi:hypothetical protein
VRRLGILSVTALLVLGGCSDGSPAPAPEPSRPTASGPTSATPEPSESGSAAAVDCAAVDDAGQALQDAVNSELKRLGIDRSDQRAFQVTLLVTSQQSKEYWTAVRDAVPADEADLHADADTVVAYWAALDADLDAIEVADGGEAAVQDAMDRFAEVSNAHPDTDVTPAQDRVLGAVRAACGDGGTTAP